MRIKECQFLFLLRPLRLHSGYFGNAAAYSRLEVYLPVCLHLNFDLIVNIIIILLILILILMELQLLQFHTWSDHQTVPIVTVETKFFTNSWRACGAILFLIGSKELVLMPAFFLSPGLLFRNIDLSVDRMQSFSVKHNLQRNRVPLYGLACVTICIITYSYDCVKPLLFCFVCDC